MLFRSGELREFFAITPEAGGFDTVENVGGVANQNLPSILPMFAGLVTSHTTVEAVAPIHLPFPHESCVSLLPSLQKREASIQWKT